MDKNILPKNLQKPETNINWLERNIIKALI